MQRDEVAAHGLRGHLALVDPGVPLLGPLDVQRPVVAQRRVRRLEALVRRVSVAAHRQDVQVAVADPRHLRGRCGLEARVICDGCKKELLDRWGGI